jgi:hypothetical protein
MMEAAILTVTLSLILVVALNWRRFEAMGTGRVLRLALIWASIFVAGVLIVRLLGLA